MLIDGVSSIRSFDFPITEAASISWIHSSSFNVPVLSFSASIPDSRENILLISCSFDISKENITILLFSLNATFSAMLSARAVFPIDGRAARSIRSDGWSPAVLVSRSINPVGTPVMGPLFMDAFLIASSAFPTTSLIGTKSFAPFF